MNGNGGKDTLTLNMSCVANKEVKLRTLTIHPKYSHEILAWLGPWLVPELLNKKGPPLPFVRHVDHSNHLIQMNLWAQNFAAGQWEPVTHDMIWDEKK